MIIQYPQYRFPNHYFLVAPACNKKPIGSNEALPAGTATEISCEGHSGAECEWNILMIRFSKDQVTQVLSELGCVKLSVSALDQVLTQID